MRFLISRRIMFELQALEASSTETQYTLLQTVPAAYEEEQRERETAVDVESRSRLTKNGSRYVGARDPEA